MKKLTLLFAFLPVFCFAQNKQDTTKKIKFQYIQLELTGEQYDTVNYVLSKTIAEFPTAMAAIKLFKSQAHIVTVYDTVADALLHKNDSVKIKPKKLKK